MKPQPTPAHPILDLLRQRWSPRAFDPRPVEPEQLLTLLEAARWAASAGNEQPWRFLLATRDDPATYDRLFGCLKEANQVWAKTAPVLLLATVRTTWEKNGQPNRWVFHDLGLAVGNLTVQATALGLYVHSMGGFSVEQVRDSFRLPPELEPVTVLAIGYLGDPATLPAELQAREAAAQVRRPLEEFLLK